MRIQFISLSAQAAAFSGAGLELSSFSNPRPFDEYDWNVIDTNSRYVWESKQKSYHRIALEDEVALLGRLARKTMAKVLFLLPGDVLFRYHYLPHTAYKFQKSIHLSEIPAVASAILAPLLGDECTLEVVPAKSVTVRQSSYASLFRLNSPYATLVEEDDAVRMVRLNPHQFATSLLATDYNSLVHLLQYIDETKEVVSATQTPQPQKEIEKLPAWLDDVLLEEDRSLATRIRQLENELAQKRAALAARREAKALLAAHGSKLSQYAVDALKEATQTPLNAMRYLDLEDGRFIFGWEEGHLFVLCRADEKALHIDDLNSLKKRVKTYEQKTKHHAKGLLITNHQYHVPPEERTPLDLHILQEAQKNNLLVCTTKTLLSAMDAVQNHTLDANAFRQTLLEESGLLNY